MKILNQKIAIFFSGVVVAAIASAFLAPMTLVINGKSVPGKTATVDGATYVPLSALKAAGVTADVKGTVLTLNMPTAGGANQISALEGGLNEWLFNGIWRLKVTSVNPTDDGRPGWKIHVELRNGTKLDNVALAGTGFDSLSLIMADGNPIAPSNISDIRDAGLGQGASLNVDLIFYDDDGAGRKPDRLILRLQPDETTRVFLKNQGASYTVGDPSFRIKLFPDKS